jgi:hypothetical protein
MGGFPCFPYSKNRFKKGKTSKTGSASAHPDYETLMKGLPRLLDSREPMMWVVEEVEAIADKNPDTGKSPLDEIADEAAARNFAVRALKLNHGSFIENERARIFVIGCAPACGGKQGADWISAKLQMMDTLQKSRIAAKVLDVAKISSYAEEQRLVKSEAQKQHIIRHILLK